MKYKDILGYSKPPRKKLIKEQVKPKVNKVLKDIKQELNESSVALGIQTLKDNPPFQIKEVGAAVEYRKYSKKIDKTRDLFGREVLKFYELLRKKGLNDAADTLLDNYKNNVIKFGKEFKEMIRKMI